jgi:hypothetical protein
MSCQGPYERSSAARGECRGSVDQQEASTRHDSRPYGMTPGRGCPSDHARSGQLARAPGRRDQCQARRPHRPVGTSMSSWHLPLSVSSGSPHREPTRPVSVEVTFVWTRRSGRGERSGCELAQVKAGTVLVPGSTASRGRATCPRDGMAGRGGRATRCDQICDQNATGTRGTGRSGCDARRAADQRDACQCPRPPAHGRLRTDLSRTSGRRAACNLCRTARRSGPGTQLECCARALVAQGMEHRGFLRATGK